MINLLELSKRQVYILTAVTVALGAGLIIAAAVAVNSAAPTMTASDDVIQPTRQVRTQPDKPAAEPTLDVASDGQGAPVAPEPITTQNPQKTAPAQPQRGQDVQPAAPVEQAQPGLPEQAATPAIDATQLTPRICYLAIAAQDIELRTACGKGLGIWATTREAVEWLTKHGWQ